jgi:branched-chain amino acid transport system permease protein/neutral amino acid transport system permease protein
MDPTEIARLVINGIVLGSILTLGAIGLSLQYGILRFANFAHGDFMTLGAYFGLFAVTAAGVDAWMAIPFAMLMTFLVALAIDQTLYKRLRSTQPIILLIASVGIAFMLRSAISLVWGTDNHVYVAGIEKPFRVGDIPIKPTWIFIVAGAAVLVLALHLFLSRTKTGKAMRAMSDNRDLAQASGIAVERVIIWTWAISAALAAAAGVMLGMDTQLNPIMGWKLLLPIFAAAILGGIGKPYGAIAGGLTIGVAQELSTLVISPAYKPAIAFGLMVIMLIWRPTGLFGGRST